MHHELGEMQLATTSLQHSESVCVEISLLVQHSKAKISPMVAHFSLLLYFSLLRVCQH